MLPVLWKRLYLLLSQLEKDAIGSSGCKLGWRALLSPGKIDELQVQAGCRVNISHVGPNHVGISVRTIRQSDVITVEPCTVFAPGDTGPEETRLARM